MVNDVEQNLIQTMGKIEGTLQVLVNNFDNINSRFDRIEERFSKVEESQSKFKDKIKDDIQEIKITQGKYGLICALVATVLSLSMSKLLDFFVKGV